QQAMVEELMLRDGLSWHQAWKQSGAEVQPPDAARRRQRSLTAWRTAALVFGGITGTGVGLVLLLWLAARDGDDSSEMAAGVLAGAIALPTFATWLATIVCLIGIASRTNRLGERLMSIGAAVAMSAAIVWLFTFA
ncbi:MAG: hypothetical protein ACR2N7_07750, partial [Acidimicrobiia bacterium]